MPSVRVPSILMRLASVAVASGFVNLERSTFILNRNMALKATAEASIEKQLRETFPGSSEVTFTGGGSIRVDDKELYYKVRTRTDTKLARSLVARMHDYLD